jgi:hypothetical protein
VIAILATEEAALALSMPSAYLKRSIECCRLRPLVCPISPVPISHEENIALSGMCWSIVIPTRGSADQNARRSALDNNRLSVWRKTSLR